MNGLARTGNVDCDAIRDSLAISRHVPHLSLASYMGHLTQNDGVNHVHQWHHHTVPFHIQWGRVVSLSFRWGGFIVVCSCTTCCNAVIRKWSKQVEIINKRILTSCMQSVVDSIDLFNVKATYIYNFQSIKLWCQWWNIFNYIDLSDCLFYIINLLP